MEPLGTAVLWVNTSPGESWSSSGSRKQPELRVCRDSTVCLHSLLRGACREFGLAVLTLFLPTPVWSCPGLSVPGQVSSHPQPALSALTGEQQGVWACQRMETCRAERAESPLSSPAPAGSCGCAMAAPEAQEEEEEICRNKEAGLTHLRCDPGCVLRLPELCQGAFGSRHTGHCRKGVL